MNLQEFQALAVGDKIENAMSQSSGVVIEATKLGVRVRWGNSRVNPHDVSFFYSTQGTQWFHWSKIEPLFDADGQLTPEARE